MIYEDTYSYESVIDMVYVSLDNGMYKIYLIPTDEQRRWFMDMCQSYVCYSNYKEEE